MWLVEGVDRDWDPVVRFQEDWLMKYARWCGVAVVVSAMLVAAEPTAQAETCTLELKRLDTSSATSETQAYRSTSSQGFHMQFGARYSRSRTEEAEFAKAVKKQLAEYVSEEPFRGVAKLGTGQFGFVLDAKNEDSRGYDRLYFDLNGNGDLTDDKPIDALARDSSRGYPDNYAHHEYPRVDLKVPIEGQSLDYSFRLTVYKYTSSDYSFASASLSAAAYREGEITLEGKKRRVALLDYNGNGRFDDVTHIPGNISYSGGGIYSEMGDVLLIDAEADATQDRSGEKGRQYVSKLATLDGKFYDLEISPAGDQLTLNLSPLKIGYVTNPNGPYGAMIYGDHGFLAIQGEPGKPVAVPEGDWRLLSYDISITGWKPPPAKDEEEQAEPQGLLDALSKALTQSDEPDERPGEPRYGPRGTCTVSAHGTDKCERVAVRGGQTATLPFGPPYKPVLTSHTTRWRGNTPVSISLSLIGSGGGAVSHLVVDGYRPPQPKLTITDPEGEVVETGTFEYG
jgi:hypothetical protein